MVSAVRYASRAAYCMGRLADFIYSSGVVCKVISCKLSVAPNLLHVILYLT